MNYRHVYMLIIEHAKSEEKLGLRKKRNGEYSERHHILPRSLFPLWVTRKSNLVLLTAKEHYICHMCATKIWPTREMACAFMFMCTASKNSTMYKISRENYHKYFSGKGNPMYGRSAIREMTEEQYLEHKQKISKAVAGVKRTESWNKHISLALKGKPKSESHRKKMVENLAKYRAKALQNTIKANKGTHWFTNGKDSIRVFECPEGFVKGRILKEFDKATKAKLKLVHSKQR